MARQESPVTTELAAMVNELNALQSADPVDEERLEIAHQRHRQTVYRFMAKALIREPEDLYRAALLIEGADVKAGPDICLQAYYLAIEAVDKGFEPARYVAAASIDRYLILSGTPQRYGTQYFMGENTLYRLYPYDTTTTDSARQAWDVPVLDSLKAEIEALNSLSIQEEPPS